MAYLPTLINPEDSEFQADLRDTILGDPEAQVLLMWQGTIIIGSRGPITNGAEFDNGGGGWLFQNSFSASFCVDDFENLPVGAEVVNVRVPMVSTVPWQRRILTVVPDPLLGGVTLTFGTILQQ